MRFDGSVIEGMLEGRRGEHQARAETMLPDAIDDDASGERIALACDRFGQFQTSASLRELLTSEECREGPWGRLTLSRRIIEEYHSGSLRLVASSPGKGSTFSIMLPAVEEAGGAGPDDDTVG